MGSPPSSSRPQIPANTVGAIMTRKVVTVSPDDTAADVKRILETRRLNHLVVVANGEVHGLVSDRDLFKCLSPFIGRRIEREADANSLNRKVHQIMSRRVPTCLETETIAAAGQRMLDRDLLCLPVVDATGECVGIVTSHDLLAWCMVRCAGAADSCALPRVA
jgi:acetoin utilization protein AcuB